MHNHYVQNLFKAKPGKIFIGGIPPEMQEEAIRKKYA